LHAKSTGSTNGSPHFRASPFIRDIFGAEYQRIYGDTKRKEAITFLRTVSSFDYNTYLPRI
jgi:glutamine synthetase